MNRSLRFVVPLLVVLPIGYRATTWILRPDIKLHFAPEMSREGEELFLHEWTAGDPLAGGGDGLGPVFNANSCVACHRQAGPGGGGPLENNVTTFVKVTKLKLDESVQQGVVHANATDEAFREKLSHVASVFPSTSRPSLQDLLPRQTAGCVIAPPIGLAPGVDVSQRNTPALFGSNLIDAIPDRLIIANERLERVKWGLADSDTDDLPVGRALRLVDGHVGKFGWKAHVATLSGFVRAACANELGLGNPSQTQPVSLAQRNYRVPGLDLTDKQCDQITAFVAALPRPIEAMPDASLANRATAGKVLFHSVGCADCHLPDIGEAKGIYSDLLLHRMGKELVGGGSYGDPAPSLPDFSPGEGPQPGEWRTPPLWGVADSAPYLHDGRAPTLHDAIRLHSGQASKSVEKFQKLAEPAKGDLLAFLKSLRAPEQAQKKSPPEI